MPRHTNDQLRLKPGGLLVDGEADAQVLRAANFVPNVDDKDEDGQALHKITSKSAKRRQRRQKQRVCRVSLGAVPSPASDPKGSRGITTNTTTTVPSPRPFTSSLGVPAAQSASLEERRKSREERRLAAIYRTTPTPPTGKDKKGPKAKARG